MQNKVQRTRNFSVKSGIDNSMNKRFISDKVRSCVKLIGKDAAKLISHAHFYQLYCEMYSESPNPRTVERTLRKFTEAS